MAAFVSADLLLHTEGVLRMLQGCTPSSVLTEVPCHTMQARTARDAMNVMRLALRLVLEGDGNAEDVSDSLATVPSVDDDEEDVVIDSPDDDSAAKGVACKQHVGSARASLCKAHCALSYNRCIAWS